MTYTTEELRMIAVSAPVWLRLLEVRQTRILDRIHGEFSNGTHEQVANLATLTCIRDQINEIKQSIINLEKRKE